MEEGLEEKNIQLNLFLARDKNQTENYDHPAKPAYLSHAESYFPVGLMDSNGQAAQTHNNSTYSTSSTPESFDSDIAKFLLSL